MTRIFLLLTIMAMMSCDSQESSAEKSLGAYDYETLEESYHDEEKISFQSEADDGSASISKRRSKVIKTGNVSMEVTVLEKSKNAVDSIANRYQAQYEDESYSSYGSRIEYDLVLRIPSENFDSLVLDIQSGIGSITSKNINARDVTEEYVDLEIRLENNLAYLEQYRAILKKATSIKDVLNVQEKIRRLEEEVESKKGRLKFLDDQVAYSTLHLNLSQLVVVESYAGPHFGTRLLNAFSGGFDFFLAFIVGSVRLWPFILLVSILILLRKRFVGFFRSAK